MRNRPLAPDASLAPLLVSTDMLPERERFDAWRETFALRLVRVDVTTPDHTAFRAALALLPLERMSLVTCNVSAVDLMRTKQLVHDGNDDLCLVICMKGKGQVHFGDASVTLEPGDATLVPHDRVGGIKTTVDAATLSLRLPRELLREILGPDEPPSLRLIPRHDPRLVLLSTYAQHLATTGNPLQPATAGLAGRHLAELVAHLFDPAAEIVRAERFGGVKAARLRAVFAGIEQHLPDPELSGWLAPSSACRSARAAPVGRSRHRLCATGPPQAAGMGARPAARSRRAASPHRRYRLHGRLQRPVEFQPRIPSALRTHPIRGPTRRLTAGSSRSPEPAHSMLT